MQIITSQTYFCVCTEFWMGISWPNFSISLSLWLFEISSWSLLSSSKALLILAKINRKEFWWKTNLLDFDGESEQMIKLNLEFNLMRLGDSCTQISRQNLRMLPNLSENIFPSVIFNNQLRNPKLAYIQVLFSKRVGN